MKSRARLARVHVVADGGSLISSAGGALLTETARLTGLNRRLSHGLRRWRGLGAVHDPGKIVQDLASAIALGGDCLADIAVVRAQSELFGPVASDPTVSRLIDKLATDVDSALGALRKARADARAVAWEHRCPVSTDGFVPVDIDGTIVVAHSEKESAQAPEPLALGRRNRRRPRAAACATDPNLSTTPKPHDQEIGAPAKRSAGGQPRPTPRRRSQPVRTRPLPNPIKIMKVRG